MTALLWKAIVILMAQEVSVACSQDHWFWCRRTIPK